ncbi:MAG: sigma-70 factor domain-containing protein, partial [Acidimicrobiia bacterium]
MNSENATLVDETGRLTSDSLSQYLAGIGGRALLTAEDEVRLAQAMEAGVEARVALDEGVSDPVERARLERVCREGQRARQDFIQANLRLVVSNARL